MSEIKQENLHKELEMLQAVIVRMANNSFLIKGWTITLMAALLALGKDLFLTKSEGTMDNKGLVLAYLIGMFVVLISFWWLDAFYLRQERIFRAIFEKAIADPNATDRVRYDLSPRQETKPNSGITISSTVESVWNILVTDFMKWFYVPFLIFIMAGLLMKAINFI